MSDSGENKTDAAERQALTQVESAVERLLEDRASVVERSQELEGRIRELEDLLGKFMKGTVDVASLEEAVGRLSERNAELTGRINEGKEGVERLLSRFRFLENQR